MENYSEQEATGSEPKVDPYQQIERREVLTEVHPDGTRVVTETYFFFDGTRQVTVTRFSAPPSGTTPGYGEARPPPRQESFVLDAPAGTDHATREDTLSTVTGGEGDLDFVRDGNRSFGDSCSHSASADEPEVYARDGPSASVAAAAFSAGESAASRSTWLEERRARKERENAAAVNQKQQHYSTTSMTSSSEGAHSAFIAENSGRGTPSTGTALSAGNGLYTTEGSDNEGRFESSAAAEFAATEARTASIGSATSDNARHDNFASTTGGSARDDANHGDGPRGYPLPATYASTPAPDQPLGNHPPAVCNIIESQTSGSAGVGETVTDSSQPGNNNSGQDRDTGGINLVSARLVVPEENQRNPCSNRCRTKNILVYIFILLLVIIGLLLGYFLRPSASDGPGTATRGTPEASNFDDSPNESPSSQLETQRPTTLPPAGNAPTPGFPAQIPVKEPTSTPILPPTTLSPTASATSDPILPLNSTLEALSRRGALRCGVPESQLGFNQLNGGNDEGFSVDLCRAVAAAVFNVGPGRVDNRIELFPLSLVEGFAALGEDEVDVLALPVTHTMERDVYLSEIGTGFSFTVPYLYTGLSFGGIPPYGTCANKGDSGNDNDENVTSDANNADAPEAGPCAGLRICVEDGTTFAAALPALVPGAGIVLSPTKTTIYRNFADGFCNAIAGDQFEVSEAVVRAAGYTGDYENAEQLHSRDPLAMVTRDDDSQWADFVNWVVQALLAADERKIRKDTASFLATTDLFGERYSNMFVNAVAAVGNYGEMYERNLQDIVPRTNINMINEGGSGLIYSFPFGSLTARGPRPAPEGTIDSIVKRGELRCGISRRAGFAEFDSRTQSWSGLDVDYCRALSAALFSGVYDTVVYTNLPPTERLIALANGDVDVLSRMTTVTAERDVMEKESGEGFSFSQPNFYDGLSFGGITPYGRCADNLDTSNECADLRICVAEGTTFVSRIRELFPERFIVLVRTDEGLVRGLSQGACNAIAGGVQDVAEASVIDSGFFDNTDSYEVGFRRFSKDPLALVTKQNDPQWSAFVYWVVAATFYAEEQGINQEDANNMPIVELFGPLYMRMYIDVIQAVGNYGEIYERNVQEIVPRNGLNLLNTEPFGPQHYPLPGV